MNYKIDNFTKKNIDEAQEWFKVHNINTFVNDSNTYIEVAGFEFKLCNYEVRYRAEEYKRLKENNLITK
tara:strand:+ start:50 stop:256 length:207 start_codon:yes stop_codon:yes gene_type:complete